MPVVHTTHVLENKKWTRPKFLAILAEGEYCSVSQVGHGTLREELVVQVRPMCPQLFDQGQAALAIVTPLHVSLVPLADLEVDPPFSRSLSVLGTAPSLTPALCVNVSSVLRTCDTSSFSGASTRLDGQTRKPSLEISFLSNCGSHHTH